MRAKGVIVRIGAELNTRFICKFVSVDSEGYIIASQNMEASVRKIFAAGDIRQASARQIATAVGDGVTAAIAADRFIKINSRSLTRFKSESAMGKRIRFLGFPI